MLNPKLFLSKGKPLLPKQSRFSLDLAAVNRRVRRNGSRYPSDLIFGGLLIVISLAVVLLGSIEPWWEGFFESALFMLGAWSLVRATVEKRWRFPPVLAPVAALFLVSCIQIMPFWASAVNSNSAADTVSFDPVETKGFSIKFLAIAVALALLLHYTSNRKRLLALAHLVMFAGIASVGFAIWRRLFPDSVLSSLGGDTPHDLGFGQFFNRNHFALLMEMSMGPAFVLGLSARSMRKRLLYFEVVIVLCLAVVMTTSRGGIISMMGQFAFVSWIYFGALVGRVYNRCSSIPGAAQFLRDRRALMPRLVIVLLLLSVFFVGVMWLGGEPVRHRMESVPSEFLARRDDLPNQNPRRLEIWAATLKLIEANPLVGSGLGAYETAATRYLRGEGNWQPQQAHNEYLELLAGGGILAGVIGVWFVVILVRESRQRLRDADSLRRALCLGAISGLLGVAIHSLVDFGLHVMANALICCCLIVLATTKIHSAPNESHLPVRL